MQYLCMGATGTRIRTGTRGRGHGLVCGNSTRCYSTGQIPVLVPRPPDLKTYLHPPEKLQDLQLKIAYPIKIVGVYSFVKLPMVSNSDKSLGTRKPREKWFWAWDANLSYLFYDRINPYLYLTYQDKNGQIIGPIRYHSELRGFGVKLECAFRAQFGRLSGFDNIEFHELPTKFEIEKGFDSVFGGFFCYHYGRIKFKGPLAPVLLQYFGVGTIGGYGAIKLKSGEFEAEEETTSTGVRPALERVLLLLLAVLSVVGFVATVGPMISAAFSKDPRLPIQ